MEKRRIMACLMVLTMLITSLWSGNIPVNAAGSKVSTKMYTISKKPGTYKKSVGVTVKAKKGYKVYYTTGSKLTTKNVIKSGKSKKLTFKKTTTLKIYAVKKSAVITKKKLAQKKVLKKAVSYKYKIAEDDNSSKDDSDKTKTDDSSKTDDSDKTKTDDSSKTDDSDKTKTDDSGKTDDPAKTPSNTPITEPSTGNGGTSSDNDPKNPADNPNTPDNPDNPDNPGTPDNPDDQGSGDDDQEKVKFGSKTGGTSVLHMDIEEESFDVKKDVETTVSADNSEGEYVNVIIPEGTFDEDTNISIKVEDGKIDIRQDGKEFTRLNEFVKIQIPLSEIPEDTELDYYKAAYFFGDTVYFIDPDREQLRKGILEFETAHFSWFGATKLSEAEMQERMARNKALDEVTLEYKQKAIQSVIDDLASESLSKLGIAEGSSAYTAISRSLGQSTEFYNLIKSARENDHEAAMQKLAEITITTLSENPEYLSSTKVNIASSIVGNTGNLVKAYRNGEYVEAFNAVMKTYADTIPAVKWGKAAVSVWQTGVDWIKDYETDAAYQVFLGEIRDGEHGVVLSNDGSGTDGWNRVLMQMQTTINQKVIEMKRSGSKSYMDYTAEETAEMRALVTEQLQNMFVNRYQKEQEIEKRVKEKKEILNALGREKLLSLLFYGDYVNNDYEVLCERMMRIYDSVKEMVGEENLKLLGDSEMSELAYMTYLFVDESWANGKKALGGRAAVFQYMKEKYNVDIDDLNVALSSEDMIMFGKGKTTELELVGAGSASTTWGTTNSSVATVVNTGDKQVINVKAVGDGVCKVYAIHNGKRYECWVTVRSVIEMEPVSVTIYCTTQISIPFGDDDDMGYETIKWTTNGVDVRIDNTPSAMGSYNADITAGSEPGTAEVYALVGGEKLYKWVVTVDDISLSVSVLGMEDVIINEDNNGFVINIDFDKMDQECGENIPKFFSVNYFGPEVSLYDESEPQLKRNEIMDGAEWRVNKNMFKIDHDWGTYGFRGYLMYVGSIPVSFEIPSIGKTLSFTFYITGTPKIEVLGEKGTAADFEITVLLRYVPKYEVVCHDYYDKTQYGEDYIPSPTAVSWSIGSGSDCFYVTSDTSRESYYALCKIKTIQSGYSTWNSDSAAGDLILGINAEWSGYTAYEEKVYRHVTSY